MNREGCDRGPVSTVYVSVGCNQVPHCLDWGNNNLICYGGNNSIYIYNPQEGAGGMVTHTLTHHKERVNCVAWIRDFSGGHETELVSGSTDKSLAVWSKSPEGFDKIDDLIGHKDSINSISCNNFKCNNDTYTLIVSGSADSLVIIWKRKSPTEKFEIFYTIDVSQYGFCFCSKLHLLSNTTSPLLALSVDDRSSKLMLYSINETEVNKLTNLSGHEDWIRDMDFVKLDDGTSILATASQDSMVRLWKFCILNETDENAKTQPSLSVKPTLFRIDSIGITVSLETVLRGHEDRVCAVQWATNKTNYNELCLMTSSFDRTIIEWCPDIESGVWLERVRLGEMGGDSLGYIGAKYSPTNENIIAYTHQSAFHKWKKTTDRWEPDVTVGGHYDSVTDITWEKQGRCLLSTSLDQTTRLHGLWKDRSSSSWHQLSRPQVHGHAMNSITALPNFSFVSAADEKVSRAFTAPGNVLENLNNLCALQLETSLLTGGDSQPAGATVPALGLSNKAVFSTEKHEKEQNSCDQESFTPQKLEKPPTEEMLVQNTLWPETMKLYGHGNQVYCLTSSSDGKIVASACKATNKNDAIIILWNTESWDKIQTLEGHNLTVTRMEFSPDDSKLLSVSRDRTWTLFSREDNGSFELKCKSPGGYHGRIIWDCTWTHDGRYFATGSRDGVIVCWTVEGSPCGTLNLPKQEVPTALTWAPESYSAKVYLLAAGYESGMIEFISYAEGSQSPWKTIYSINKNSHSLTVTRLRFQPHGKPGQLLLASSSADHSVRINLVDLKCMKLNSSKNESINCDKLFEDPID